MLILLFPPFRKMVEIYFNKLDMNRIKPDEEDLYWAGRRQGYNFGGISYKDRLEEIEWIDKENGHIIIQ